MFVDSGIYVIENVANGDFYVGSAISFRLRWNGHRAALRSNRHHNRFLQAAWNKYGAEVFLFRKLLVCAKDHLLMFEQRAMDVLNPKYNLAKKAGNTMGVRFTEEAKRKIAAKALGRKRTPEAIERSAAAVRGKKRPPEKIVHLLGNTHAKGLKHTDEWKAACSAFHKGRPRPKDAAYRAKISAALKGIPHSPERRAKAAAAQKLKRLQRKLGEQQC